MHLPTLLLLSTPLLAAAQFGSFFDQMFHGGSQGSHGGQHHQQRRQNVASDPSWYKETYGSAPCDKYLCEGTLACVDLPTHCPCAFDEVQEKVELDGEGLSVCVSRRAKGPGRAEVVEAMRKGYL